MKSIFTSLEKIWNQNKEKFDMLIYIPHGNIDKNFLKQVRETSKINLDNISDELLFKYMYHEADTWVVEVVESMKKYFLDSDFSIWILKVEIPRWYCDLNRPLNIAFSDIFQNFFWEKIYNEALDEVDKIVEKSDFIFQFHSMNSFNPIEKSKIWADFSENFIKNHIKKVYSGSKRECTILTETDKSEYISNKKFDDIFRKKFKENNIVLEENTAYQFLDFFPCTKITRENKSSFFEIIKWALATEKTKDKIDTNEIIFDQEKIDFFAKILSEIILEYLKTTKK